MILWRNIEKISKIITKFSLYLFQYQPQISQFLLYEALHQKTCFLHMLKQRCTADRRLCFSYTDSTIPLLSKSQISSLQPSSVAAQFDLCRTWSEPRRLVFSRHCPIIQSLEKLFLKSEQNFEPILTHCGYTKERHTKQNKH